MMKAEGSVSLLQGSLSLRLFGQQYLQAGGSFSLLRTDPAKQGTEWFWLMGVLVTLVGATLTVVGLMIQKQAHAAHSKNQASAAKPYWLETLWLAGGGVWLFGNAVCWVALGLAPQAILASINCWNIAVTLVIAPWFLNEPVSARTAWSTVVLTIGTAWVVICGPKEYQQQTVEGIVESLQTLPCMMAFVATTGFLLSMAVVAYSRIQSRRTPTLTYFQFAAVSATFAWYATMLSKSCAKVLVASVRLGIPMYHNPAFWALASGFVVCAMAQVHFLNMSLKHGEAVHAIPTYEALSMTGQIVVGGVVFDEFAGLSRRAHMWFWPGVFLVLLGILSLARGASLQSGVPPVPEKAKVPIQKKGSECDERTALLSDCSASGAKMVSCIFGGTGA